jgi:Flp pilus assembly protein TadD
MTGDLVGTLRYMSPEQALAKRVVVDHRTDVYSLGAALYELLTLEPAFRGTDRQELLRQIAFEEPRPPRRMRKSIPFELETIVLKAMEKNPADQYATAKDVAEDLRRYLYHEPIKARRPNLVQWVRKWGRRHKAVLATAAVCLLVSLAALFGSMGYVLGDRRARQREAENKVLEALEAANPGLRDGNPHDPALIAAVERAEAQLGSGVLGQELQHRVEQLRLDHLMLARLEDAYLQPFASSKEGEFDYARADQLYAYAFTEYGIEVTAQNPQQAAEQVRTSVICTHLLAALDHWAHIRRRALNLTSAPIQAVADRADDNPWTRQLRNIMGQGDRAALERLAEESALSHLATTLRLLARALKNVGSWAVAEQLLRRAQLDQPADLWINFELAHTLGDKESPELEQAARFYQAALVVRPQSFVVYLNLSAVLSGQGRFPEAEAACWRAIALSPDSAKAYNNLGQALRGHGKTAEAEAAFRKAIALMPDLATPYTNLGGLLSDQGKRYEAEVACRKAIALQPNDAEAHNNLGVVLSDLGKLEEGVAAYRKAIALRSKDAKTHSNLGNTLLDLGRLDEAIVQFREATRLNKDFIHGYNGLGIALMGKGKAEAAIVEFTAALRIDPNHSGIHRNLGLAFRDNRQLDAAITQYQEAIRLKKGFSEAYNDLGDALTRQGRVVEAENAFRQAVQFKPSNAEAHCNLGDVLLQQGRFKEALEARKRGHDLGSRRPGWPYPSALWVQQAEHLVELDAKLARIRRGETKPGTLGEKLELARICGL